MATLFELSPRQWERRIMAISSEVVSLNARCVAVAIVLAIYDSPYKEPPIYEGHFRVYDGYIAKMVGEDKKSVKRARKELGTCFSMMQTVERVGKVPHTTNWYLPSESLLNGIITNDAVRNRGRNQKNYLCKECGSTDTFVEEITRITKRCTCRNCGAVAEKTRERRKVTQ